MKRFAKLFETAGHQVMASASSIPCACGGCTNRVPVLRLATKLEKKLVETEVVLSGPSSNIALVVDALQPAHFRIILECLQRLTVGEPIEQVHEQLQLMFYEIGHQLA